MVNPTNPLNPSNPLITPDHTINPQTTKKQQIKIIPPKQQESEATLLPRELSVLDLTSMEDSANAQIKNQQEKIDQALTKINAQKKKKNLFDSSNEWRTQRLNLVMSGNSTLKNGVEFLEKLLPKNLLEEPSIKKHFEQTYTNSDIVGLFLKSLSTGLNGRALIFKSKILKETLKILNLVKKEYQENQIQIPKEILEWEVVIQSQKERLALEQLKFGIATTNQTISLTNKFFNLFPIRSLRSFSEKFARNLGPIATFLGLSLAYLGYKAKIEVSSVFDEWKKTINKWKKSKNLGTITLLDSPKKMPNIDSNKHKNQGALKPEKNYEQILDGLIKSTTEFSKIKKYLKIIDVNIKPSQKHQLFLNKWEHNPKFRKKLILKLKTHHEYLKNVEKSGQTCNELLLKRKRIFDEKLIKFRPRFEELKPKLIHLKQQKIITSLRQIVSDGSRDSTITIQNMKDQIKNKTGLNIQAEIVTKSEALDYISKLATDVDLPPYLKSQFEKIEFKQDDLLAMYIDHQETLEITSKSALQQMVQNKHKLENKFVKFKLMESKIKFYLLTASLVTGVVLATLTLLAFPIGGAALVALGLSIGTTAAGYGISITGIYLTYKYRRNSLTWKNFFNSTEITIRSLMLDVYHLKMLVAKKKVLQNAKIVNELKNDKSSEKRKKILDDFEQSKNNLQEVENTIKKYKDRIEKLNNYLMEDAWKDFVQYADLKISSETGKTTSNQATLANTRKGKLEVSNEASNSGSLKKENQIESFDTLNSLRKALEELDVSLIDQDTRVFLEGQLNINLESAQESLKQNPKAIKNAIKSFYSKDDTLLFYALKLQDKRLKAGLIPSPPS